MAHHGFMRRLAILMASAASGGIVLLSLPSCEAVLTTVNPCATVFEFCDANDIELLFADVPDFDLDPTCTIPFLAGCSAGNIFPQGGGP